MPYEHQLLLGEYGRTFYITAHVEDMDKFFLMQREIRTAVQLINTWVGRDMLVIK
jgi:hypothetical protein